MKTVADLVKELQELDQTLPVVMSSDPEGNQFHFFQEVDGPYYIYQHDLRQGYYIDSIHSEEDIEDDGREIDDYAKVAVIWP